jgi:protein SCO1/2
MTGSMWFRFFPPRRIFLAVLGLVAAAGLSFFPPPALAQEYAADEKVGVEEKLGETIPLDLEFRDEEGKTVEIGQLLRRPTVLTLVYFRCPSICAPLMHEVASNVDKIDLVPGVDYDLVTVSFDDRETPELARTAKKNLLDEMETKVPPDSWRFLTGEADDIARLADAVGFRFKRDKQDFVHAATVIFLTKDGKIVRYLGGLKLLPADLELAILDAARGTPRTLMQRIQQLCYAFDPAGKTYVLQVNRIILAVSLGGLGIFLAFLLLFRRKRPEAETPGEVGEPTTERSS